MFWNKVLLAAVLSLLAGVAQAQACRVLDPELQDAYDGQCVNGLAEGSGSARGRAEYRGDFKNGMKHGKGVKVWPNGDRYEGDFIEDRKEGFGSYSFGRGPWLGERYEGDWLADRREGYGVYRWPTGDIYRGPWHEDRITGASTPMMQARSRFAAETRTALAQPGQKACKELEVGIGGRDWMRGVVVDLPGKQFGVLIEDAGRTPHVLGGVEVKAGMVVVDSVIAWAPCY